MYFNDTLFFARLRIQTQVASTILSFPSIRQGSATSIFLLKQAAYGYDTVESIGNGDRPRYPASIWDGEHLLHPDTAPEMWVPTLQGRSIVPKKHDRACFVRHSVLKPANACMHLPLAICRCRSFTMENPCCHFRR